MEVRVRKALSNDIKDFFYWRNNKKIRPMLKNTDPILWKEHSEWYEKSLKRSDHSSIICYFQENQTKIGFVSFDIKKTFALISIIIDPKMQKKKLSTVCLKESINFFKNENPNINLIIAEIKSDNTISKKAFLRAGFKLNKIKDDICNYEFFLI